jgi:hypothetical protein
VLTRDPLETFVLRYGGHFHWAANRVGAGHKPFDGREKDTWERFRRSERLERKKERVLRKRPQAPQMLGNSRRLASTPSRDECGLRSRDPPGTPKGKSQRNRTGQD